jgi:hypothetical protein
VQLVASVAGKVTIRGDTDFTQTAHLDRWDEAGVRFLLGMDAHPKVVQLAEALAPSAWQRLERLPKYEILSEPRKKAFRFKEQIVVEKEFNIRFWSGKTSRKSNISRTSAVASIAW